jgi:hypothetical protein
MNIRKGYYLNGAIKNPEKHRDYMFRYNIKLMYLNKLISVHLSNRLILLLPTFNQHAIVTPFKTNSVQLAWSEYADLAPVE